MNPKTLIGEVIEAHGGARLWGEVEALEAVLSASGLLFRAKRRPPLVRASVLAAAREPRLIFRDFPAAGQTAELVGPQEVRVTGASGAVLAARQRPRDAFSGLSRLLRWDDLDFVYFAGYASWNYLVTPFLFLQGGFRFEVEPPASSLPTGWTRLRATFPEGIPTHCIEQVFTFDEKRLLRRLDYRAEVVGRWANAAHFCDEYRDFGGIKAPVRRRVLPRLPGGWVSPTPILVAIDVHDLRPVMR